MDVVGFEPTIKKRISLYIQKIKIMGVNKRGDKKNINYKFFFLQ